MLPKRMPLHKAKCRHKVPFEELIASMRPSPK